MNLEKAIEDIVLEKYPNYRTKINVINNTVRLKLIFKSESHAKGFVRVLSKALRQRLDSKFMIFYEYLEGPLCIHDRVVFPEGGPAPDIIDLQPNSINSDKRRIKIL